MRAPALAALALTACATAVGNTPPPAPEAYTRSIAFETGPCFGACPVYRVTIDQDGSGLFEGRRFTAITGERSFRVTPAQYRAFVRHLDPLRPLRGEVRYSGSPPCARMATDLPSADVVWRTNDGAEQRLYFYYGCDMERNRAIAERLTAAPGLLPIGDYIGERR